MYSQLTGAMKSRSYVCLLCWLFLVSCDDSPTNAPFDIASPVDATAEGLEQLYQNECIKQHHRDWFLAEAERRRDYYCNSFVIGEGERGDCESEVEHFISWNVLATDGSIINIMLDQQPSAGRIQYCVIEISNDRLGLILRDVAFRIAQTDAAFDSLPHHYVIGPPNDIKGEGWIWASSPNASEIAPHLKVKRSKEENRNSYRWSLSWLTDGTLLLPVQ